MFKYLKDNFTKVQLTTAQCFLKEECFCVEDAKPLRLDGAVYVMGKRKDFLVIYPAGAGKEKLNEHIFMGVLLDKYHSIYISKEGDVTNVQPIP